MISDFYTVFLTNTKLVTFFFLKFVILNFNACGGARTNVKSHDLAKTHLFALSWVRVSLYFDTFGVFYSVPFAAAAVARACIYSTEKKKTETKTALPHKTKKITKKVNFQEGEGGGRILTKRFYCPWYTRFLPLDGTLIFK